MARRDKEEAGRHEDDEDGMDEGEIARDYVMARAAGALASLEAAKIALVDMLSHFVNPDDDKKGAERKELVDAALEAASCAVRGIEEIDEAFDDADMEASEPWEEAEVEAEKDERKRGRR